MQRGTVRKDEFMNPVKITVSTKEPGLARDIARGLTELGKNLIIKIVDVEGIAEKTSQTDAEVLVTDFDEKIAEKAGFEPSDVVWICEDTPQISGIYRRIMDIVCRKREETYGAGMSRPEGESIQASRILSFFSRQGGSGVTSAAVTAGRMLAGRFGEKVLYVSMTEMDDSLYYDETFTEEEQAEINLTGSVKELWYRLKNHRPIFMEHFVRRDVYGLEYLQTGSDEILLKEMDADTLQMFLMRLIQRGGYGWILLDLGKTSSCPACSVSVEVSNLRDQRSKRLPEAFEESCGELEITILNNAARNCMDTSGSRWRLEVQYDEESFLKKTCTAGTVEICMSKCFAEGIRAFTDALMDWAMSDCVEVW